MRRRKHIAIVLLSLALLAPAAANRPSLFVALARPMVHVVAWMTDRFEHALNPPDECPWNPECI